MKLKKNIAISESGFVFNPNTGDAFSVNPIGSIILERLKEGLSEKLIKDEVTKKYDVAESQLEEDFYDFTSHLRQLHFFENG